MLPLPIAPETLLREVIGPAMGMLSKPLDNARARVMLVAIALQESGLRHRWQVLNSGDKGPARGLWQFEIGGVGGVHKHHASHEMLRLLCRDRDCNYEPRAIWAQLEHDDILAAGVARLLLYTDPFPLPDIDDEQGAWELYALRCWRPGKPHRKPWPGYHRIARELVRAA